MSDWDDKSNYEINKAVAKMDRRKEYTEYKKQQVVYLCEPEDGIPIKQFDPCTNIQDAWPIMKEHNIDIYWPDYGNCFGTVARYIEEGTVDVSEDFTDKEEALRCAMIVYLESEGLAVSSKEEEDKLWS